MRRQTFIYRFYLLGIAVSFIFLPMIELDDAIATTHTPGEAELLARHNRPKLQKPGGNNGNLEGGILLRRDSIISEEADGSFVARFTNRVNFQAQVWDPSVGTRDGDGIESVTFKILDEEAVDTNNIVHEKIEKNPGYCP
jgi:hypothetical protein